jgi:hypothetical protein
MGFTGPPQRLQLLAALTGAEAVLSPASASEAASL